MSNKYLIQSYFREPESIDRWDTIIELKRYCPDEPDFDLIVAKKAMSSVVGGEPTVLEWRVWSCLQPHSCVLP